jgi:YHS domain-containing protein
MNTHKHDHDVAYKDPVCGMSTRKAHAFLQIEYHGQPYYFCSEHCLEEFKKSPEKYIHEENHSHEQTHMEEGAKRTYHDPRV